MTLFRWFSFACVVVSLVVPERAHAQSISNLAIGTRVRVTSPAILTWTAQGIVTENQNGWLALYTNTGTVRVSAETLTRVQTSRGHRRRTTRGTAMGGLAGVAAGALIIGADTADGVIDPECGELHCFGYGFRFVLIGAGLAAGALVGHLWQSDDWGDIPLPTASVGLLPRQPGGSLIRVGLRFEW